MLKILIDKIKEQRKKFYLTEEEKLKEEKEEGLEKFRKQKRELKIKEEEARKRKCQNPNNLQVQVKSDEEIKEYQEKHQMIDMIICQEIKIKKLEEEMLALNASGILKSLTADYERTDNYSKDPGIKTLIQDLKGHYNKNRKVVIGGAIAGTLAVLLSIGIMNREIGEYYQRALSQSAPVQVVNAIKGRVNNLEEQVQALPETLGRNLRTHKEEITKKIDGETKEREKALEKQKTDINYETDNKLSSQSNYLRASFLSSLQLTEIELKDYINTIVTDQNTQLRQDLSRIYQRQDKQELKSLELQYRLIDLRKYMDKDYLEVVANSSQLTGLELRLGKIEKDYIEDKTKQEELNRQYQEELKKQQEKLDKLQKKKSLF